MDEEDYITTDNLYLEIIQLCLSIDHFEIPNRPEGGINPGTSKSFLETLANAIDELLTSQVKLESSQLQKILRYRELISHRIDNCSSLLADVFELQKSVMGFYMNTYIGCESIPIRGQLIEKVAKEGGLSAAALELFIIDGDKYHICSSLDALGRLIEKILEISEEHGLDQDRILALRDQHDGLYVAALLAGVR